MKTTEAPTECELEELGFKAAAARLSEDREMARKLRIAFEHFRVVTPEHINRFNDDLMKKTREKTGNFGFVYQRLAFTPIATYPNVPPKDVLLKIKEAKDLGCFDDFEVATIESVTVVPDPVVFGIIKGSLNKYYVAQWDDDVKIEDILRPDEG